MLRRLALIFTLLIGSLIVGWGIITWQVVSFAERDETREADAAVVLGAGVVRGRPSSVLRARIDHAINLFEDGYVDYLIFTGGVGRNDTLSEAEVSRQYAISRGIPEDKILIEESSTNTIENLSNAYRVGGSAGIDDYLIVSTPYHMRRAIWITRDIGMEAYSSPTRSIRWRSDTTRRAAIVQETISMWVHIFRQTQI
ncbi:MAG: YdcF family protein [Chloroflexota bacterium]